MDQFVIEGGHPLQGEVTPSGNKNAALPLLAACLLTEEPVTLHNVPDIGDVRSMRALMESLGDACMVHGLDGEEVVKYLNQELNLTAAE